jgi:hypothetical protein
MTREEYLQRLDDKFPGLPKLRQEIYHRHGYLLNDYTADCASQGLSIWQHGEFHGCTDYWIELTQSKDTWNLVPDFVRIFNQILSRSVEEFCRFFCGDLSSILSFDDQLREIFRYLFAFEELHTAQDRFKPIDEGDFDQYAAFELREKYDVVCKSYQELPFRGIKAEVV